MSTTIQKTRKAPTRRKAVMKTLSAAKPGLSRSAADIATADRMLQLLKSGTDLRQRKVRRTRAAIRAGKYENGLKLDIAIERLLQHLAE